jgi:DnaK suppressor protein
MVSIFKLMGLGKAKTVNSLAEETSQDVAPQSAARRPDVQAKPIKTSKKEVIKNAPKLAANKLPDPPAKAAVKTVTKPVAKPLAKEAVKPVVVAKVIPTPSVPATILAPPTAKTVVKPVVAKADKTAVKPVATAVVAPEKKSMTVSSSPIKPAPTPVASVATPAPAKAGRPSSRLAQLTVPSMAQTVASTAAKASYSQLPSPPTIVPILPSFVKKDAKLVDSWKTKPLAELTDADLMAMPDAEYMNDVQMAAFRLKLSVLKADILSSAGQTTEHLREDSAVVPDPADRATIEEEHALELRTRDRERKLLKKIEQSIVRIDAGDYGYCDETGESIGVGRLLARPTATLSLEAQQRRELKQKMFGD